MDYEELNKKFPPFFDTVIWKDENHNNISMTRNKEKQTITLITIKPNGETETTVYKKGD